jgi:glutaredoxin 3
MTESATSKPEILMYATSWCGYCARARRLLQTKGVAFREIDLDDHPKERTRMIERSGRRTVPQIFIGDKHVGGSDDLMALDASGGLDPLLKEFK